MIKFHTCPIYANRYDSSNRWSIGTNRKGCHSEWFYWWTKTGRLNTNMSWEFFVLSAIYTKQVHFYFKQKGANSCYEYSSFYKLTTQNNFALKQSRNALIVTKRSRTSANSNCQQLYSEVKIQACHVYFSFYKPSMQNKFAFTPSKNALYTNRYDSSNRWSIGTNRKWFCIDGL